MRLDVRHYTVRRGESWKRLIMVKNRLTRRRLIPTAVRAYMRDTADPDAAPFEINTMVTGEGAIMLFFDEAETDALVPGTYEFDVFATVPEGPLWTVDNYEDKPVARGTITVFTYAAISPPVPVEQ
jgi:hypothetical protein